MIDVVIKAKKENVENKYDFEKIDIKFEIEPENGYISISFEDDDYQYHINKKDFEMISKIIGGFDE